jgi:hypothetical protein
MLNIFSLSTLDINQHLKNDELNHAKRSVRRKKQTERVFASILVGKRAINAA